jgi:hypothetical protein
VPPLKRTIRNTPRTKPGIAKPNITKKVETASKREPSRTALAMPSGTEIRYEIRKVHKPRLIETGSFSLISDQTGLFCMKLVPRSKVAKFFSIST